MSWPMLKSLLLLLLAKNIMVELLSRRTLLGALDEILENYPHSFQLYVLQIWRIKFLLRRAECHKPTNILKVHVQNLKMNYFVKHFLLISIIFDGKFWVFLLDFWVSAMFGYNNIYYLLRIEDTYAFKGHYFDLMSKEWH